MLVTTVEANFFAQQTTADSNIDFRHPSQPRSLDELLVDEFCFYDPDASAAGTDVTSTMTSFLRRKGNT